MRADWSQEQLTKHSKEIISLTGNLFLRTTSAAIMKRTADVPRRNVTAVSDSAAFSPLLSKMKSLAAAYDAHMQGLQLADAVDVITLVLQEVRHALTQMFHSS